MWYTNKCRISWGLWWWDWLNRKWIDVLVNLIKKLKKNRTYKVKAFIKIWQLQKKINLAILIYFYNILIFRRAIFEVVFSKVSNGINIITWYSKEFNNFEQFTFLLWGTETRNASKWIAQIRGGLLCQVGWFGRLEEW